MTPAAARSRARSTSRSCTPCTTPSAGTCGGSPPRSQRAGLRSPPYGPGWATFKNQLHVHHTAEDNWLWPALRAKVTQPGDVAVLGAMEAEHARIDPLLSLVDGSLAAAGLTGLAENARTLTAGLAAHMEHEEDHALPLIEAYLGPDGWAAFRRAVGKSQGLRGGAELFPWMLDSAPAATSKAVLGMLPPPARLLYRTVWRPGYGRTPRWNTSPNLIRTERPAP